MRKSVLLLFCLGILQMSIAQHDPKAKEILDKVSVTTKSNSTIKVDYSLTHENVQENKKQTSLGTLELKGNKYKLLFMGNTIFCDSKTVWTYIKESNEVSISSIGEDDDDMFNPATMLTIYEKGFKYKFIQERFEKGIPLYVIDLIPENIAKVSYSRVRLSINKDKSEIFMIQYFGKDENRFTIEVKKMEKNVPMADALFVFDKSKFPNVEVVDLR